jgi:dTDP-4-dehydrorhamnose reductase
MSGVDARVPETVTAALADVRPDLVINCIGMVKQRAQGQEAVEAILVNSLLPHRLSALCALAEARFITVSTDCTFSGRTGSYREDDVPDPVDVYGRSKLLGEVHAAHAVTLRTSMIGLELDRSTGLVEWFLSQSGTVSGWDRALYSGLTTAELARVIALVAHDQPDMSGLWHVAGPSVDKHSLLVELADELGRDVVVVRNSDVVIDRTLDASRFAEATGYRPPTWGVMLAELADEVRVREGTLTSGLSGLTQ